MIGRFLEWLGFVRWRVVGCYDDLDEVPEPLPRKSVALIAAPGRLKWIVFDCACGTGHRIMLNADHSRRPFWRILARDPLSITPSIDFHGERHRCHYFIRRGRTVWARN
jgi:hypothetical protein